MEQFTYKDQRLYCENVFLGDLAGEFGTPLYVYSRQSVIEHCRWIEEALSSIDHLSCYAVKANGNRDILKLVAAAGMGADAGSAGEIRLALGAGFAPEKITFSGVGKRDDEIEFALSSGILGWNVESAEELDIISGHAVRLGRHAAIALRVNIDLPAETHPYITTSRAYNKFGVPPGEAHAILRHALGLPHITVRGIHCHIGSQITKASTFEEAISSLLKLVGELRSGGIPVDMLNIGGGFGVQYRNYIRHPFVPAEEGNGEDGLTTAGMLEQIVPLLKRAGLKIELQPGRSVVAHGGALVTRVLYRKNASFKNFVIVDAGMNDLLRPSLYGSYHQIVPVVVEPRKAEKVDVVGPLCESGDVLAVDRTLGESRRGELLAVMCTGAYGYALSSNYNGRPRPAEILVHGAEAGISTPREVIEHVSSGG